MILGLERYFNERQRLGIDPRPKGFTEPLWDQGSLLFPGWCQYYNPCVCAHCILGKSNWNAKLFTNVYMGMTVLLRFLPCVLILFLSWGLTVSVCHCSSLDPVPAPHCATRNENTAFTNKFHFHPPDCLAKRHCNSPKHLLPLHPDAQQNQIYLGWAWLKMFYQNSNIGSGMKKITSAAAKIRLKKSFSVDTDRREIYLISVGYVAPKCCFSNSRKSASATCHISIVRTCWYCLGDRHLPVETRTDTGIKNGDFRCVKPDCQSLPHTVSCHSKQIQCFSCLPLFKINTCWKLTKIKRSWCQIMHF